MNPAESVDVPKLADAERDSKPVVAIVVKSFPPAFRSGGPGRSVFELTKCLSSDFDFRIFTSLDDNGHCLLEDGVLSNTWQRRFDTEVFTIKPNFRGARKMLRELTRLAPDVLYLNSLLNPVFTVALVSARRVGLIPPARLVIAPRGELSPGALDLKAKKKRIFLALFRTLGLDRDVVWHATSPEEVAQLEHAMGSEADAVLAPVVRNVKPGTDSARRTPGAPLRVVLLSKIDPKKNIEYALRVIAQSQANVAFTIAGPIKNSEYWDRCQALISQLGLNDTVTYAGAIEPDQVVEYLAGFDVFFLPTLGENFGHVILEALAAGLPVLISDTTPWTAAINEKAGWARKLSDPGSFGSVLKSLEDESPQQTAERRTNARTIAQRYSQDSALIEASRQLFLGSEPDTEVA